MTKKRKSVRLNGSPAVWIKRYKADLQVGNYGDLQTEGSARRRDLRAAVGLVCLERLELEPRISVEKVLDDGCTVARDYFLNEWWEDNTFAEREINRKRFKRGLNWFEAFVNALAICVLADRWVDVKDICDWIDPGIQVDFMSEYQEPELGSVYNVLAASLRDRPMRGVKAIRKRISASRPMRPKHLLGALDAAIDGNQNEFESKLKSAIHSFQTMKRGPICIARDYFDLDSVIMLHVGLHFGMEIPSFHMREEAVLLTRELLGIKAPKTTTKKQRQTQGR